MGFLFISSSLFGLDGPRQLESLESKSKIHFWNQHNKHVMAKEIRDDSFNCFLLMLTKGPKVIQGRSKKTVFVFFGPGC